MQQYQSKERKDKERNNEQENIERKQAKQRKAKRTAHKEQKDKCQRRKRKRERNKNAKTKKQKTRKGNNISEPPRLSRKTRFKCIFCLSDTIDNRNKGNHTERAQTAKKPFLPYVLILQTIYCII